VRRRFIPKQKTGEAEAMEVKSGAGYGRIPPIKMLFKELGPNLRFAAQLQFKLASEASAIYDQLTMMIYQIFTGKSVCSAPRLEPWPCFSLGALRRGLPPAGWR
jgi:hypothetical protein